MLAARVALTVLRICLRYAEWDRVLVAFNSDQLILCVHSLVSFLMRDDSEQIETESVVCLICLNRKSSYFFS